MNYESIVKKFEMMAHPEGGYFKETYRSETVINKEALPNDFNGNRNISTAIYFLIPQGEVSTLHRIKSDEVWHFYLGGTLNIVQISPDGKEEIIKLGQDILNGEVLQHTVPAGFWFGAYPESTTEYAFVGCTVSPGFDFADFEMKNKEEMLTLFPQCEESISKLCK